MKNLKQNRESYLPGITDWTSDHLDKKYPKSVKKQSFNEWYWFSIDNYKILKIGSPLMMTLFFGLGTSILFYLKIPIAPYLTLIATLITLISLLNSIKDYPNYKDLNMYEVHLQDTVLDDINKEAEQ